MAGDFEQLSVDYSEKLERDGKIEKIKERSSVSREAKGGDLDKPLDKGAAKAFQKALKNHTKKDRDVEEKAAAVKRLSCISRYTRYFNSGHPQLTQACGGVAPNAKWTLEEAEHHLDRVRTSLNQSGAEQACKQAVVYGAKAAEWVTMKMGVNPMEWDLTDIGPAVETHIDFFEPELQEMMAETGDMFNMPWQLRLTLKIGQFGQMYSEQRKRGGASAPSAVEVAPESKQKRVRIAEEEPRPSTVASKQQSSSLAKQQN